jgi:hypothetical protein
MKKEKRQWEKVKELYAREAEEAEQRQRRRQQEEKDRETVAKLNQGNVQYQRDDLESARQSGLGWKQEQEAKKKHEGHELMLKKRFEEEALLVKEEKGKKVIALHNRKVLLEDKWKTWSTL